MFRSCNCLGETSDGAPISRSSACWFMREHRSPRGCSPPRQQHDDAVDAGRDAAMGRRADTEARAACRRNASSSTSFGVAGDLERLVHDVRPVVPDRAGGELDAVADDVVLVGQDVAAGPCVAAPRGRPAAWRRDCGRSRSCPRPRSTRTSGNRRSSRTRNGPSRSGRARCRSRPAPAPANSANSLGVPPTKNTASPSPSPSCVADRLGALGPRFLAIGPCAFAVAEEDVAEARLALALRPGVQRSKNARAPPPGAGIAQSAY